MNKARNNKYKEFETRYMSSEWGSHYQDEEGMNLLEAVERRKELREDFSHFFFGYSRDVAEDVLVNLVGIKNYHFPSTKNSFQGVRRPTGSTSDKPQNIARLYSEETQCFFEFIEKFTDHGLDGTTKDRPMMKREDLDKAIKFFKDRTFILRGQFDFRKEFPLIIPVLENDLRVVYD